MGVLLLMKVRILALIEKSDVEHIDQTVKDGTFSSRSHYVKQAVKFFREAKDGLK